jgi:hypothetical protein
VISAVVLAPQFMIVRPSLYQILTDVHSPRSGHYTYVTLEIGKLPRRLSPARCYGQPDGWPAQHSHNACRNNALASIYPLDCSHGP